LEGGLYRRRGIGVREGRRKVTVTGKQQLSGRTQWVEEYLVVFT
jgi:hypothetical protein